LESVVSLAGSARRLSVNWAGFPDYSDFSGSSAWPTPINCQRWNGIAVPGSILIASEQERTHERPMA
jgi:hypothetical protein